MRTEEEDATDTDAPDTARTERVTLISGGALALLLAAIGSVTSFSVVSAGSADGGRYLTVNIGLGVLGMVLLLTAWRRRRRSETDSASGTSE